jgi:hypothetical protein
MEILHTGSPERKALDTLQAEIAALAKSIDQVARAGLPMDETRDAVRRAIEGQMKSPGATSFGRFASPPEAFPHAPRIMPELNWSTVIALLGEKMVVDRICDAIEASTAAPGLPRAARQAKLGELRTRLLKLERAEEREILQLEDAGHVVLRRVDADVGLVLAIWQEIAPPGRASGAREQPHGERLARINEGVSLDGRRAS